MTIAEIRELLSATYQFGMVPLDPARPRLRTHRGKSQVDGKKYEVKLLKTAQDVEIGFTYPFSQGVTVTQRFTIPLLRVTPKSIHNILRLVVEYPPAIAHHRRTIMKLLIAP